MIRNATQREASNLWQRQAEQQAGFAATRRKSFEPETATLKGVEEMKIIARLRIPKQRMTRPFSIVLAKHGHESYSTFRGFDDKQGGMEHGHYDMTFEQAWNDFCERCNRELNRDAGVFED